MDYVKPKQSHEDNLKVELAKDAQQHGLHLHMEYTHENCRFDCVFTRSGKILAIIEIKNWDNKAAHAAKINPTEQLKKYRQYGIMVLVLWNFKGIKSLIACLWKLAEDFDIDGSIHRPRLKFYPKTNKPGKKSKLWRLIDQQKKDMKSNYS